jgi:predicted nucleotidyltransferase
VVDRKERIDQIVSSLGEYDPERIILFGSHARRDADEYSDLDLVVIKETEERFLDRLKRVYEIMQPDFALDILVYTPQEFADMLEKGNPFLERVLEEGVIIYERCEE